MTAARAALAAALALAAAATQAAAFKVVLLLPAPSRLLTP